MNFFCHFLQQSGSSLVLKNVIKWYLIINNYEFDITKKTLENTMDICYDGNIEEISENGHENNETIPLKLKLVSKELNHFGAIAAFFPVLGTRNADRWGA